MAVLPEPHQQAGLTAHQRAFVEAIQANTKGLTAVSTGLCPGCEECMEDYPGIGQTREQFEEAIANGTIVQEPFFSSEGCDLCGSHLGGNFEPWHAVDADRRPAAFTLPGWAGADSEIVHGARACVDCVRYLANGDLPEDRAEAPWPTTPTSMGRMDAKATGGGKV